MSFAEQVIFNNENLKRIEEGTNELELKFHVAKLEKENGELREDNKKINDELQEMIELYQDLKAAMDGIKNIFLEM